MSFLDWGLGWLALIDIDSCSDQVVKFRIDKSVNVFSWHAVNAIKYEGIFEREGSMSIDRVNSL